MIAFSLDHLRRFCATDDARAFLNVLQPVRGGTLACDGAALAYVYGVEFEATPGCEVPAEVAAKQAAMLDHAIAHDFTGAIPAADISLHGYAPCYNCDGSGTYSEIECDECDDGTFEHGSHTYDCQHCDGSGKERVPGGDTPCRTCGGASFREDSVLFGGIEDYGINTRYLHLLHGLPGCVVSWLKPRQLIAFRFDGGCGVVAPMVGAPRWRKEPRA